MPKIADHNYVEALPSGSCLAGKHSECRGSWVGIKALRRPCDCQCHADENGVNLLSVWYHSHKSTGWFL